MTMGGARLLLGALLACVSFAPAAAADVSGELGPVSDYRYRGVSLSHERPALQGSISLDHPSGLYAQLWGSTLGHGTDTEVDLTGGYQADLSEHLNIDLSGTWYAYPSGSDTNYVEGTAATTVSHGAASAKFGISFVPPQHLTTSNVYAFTEGSYEIPRTPVSLTASLGYERGGFDEVEHGGKWDWKLGAETTLNPAKLCLAYVGSNADGGHRHALVASAFLTW